MKNFKEELKTVSFKNVLLHAVRSFFIIIGILLLLQTLYFENTTCTITYPMGNVTFSAYLLEEHLPTESTIFGLRKTYDMSAFREDTTTIMVCNTEMQWKYNTNTITNDEFNIPLN